MLVSPDRVIAHGVDGVEITPARWRYTSIAPWPQLSPDGEPMISLLRASELAFAQLGVQLDPPGHELELLRRLLEQTAGDAASVTLESAVTSVTGVSVVADPGEGERIVATSRGSGFPPYTAVFAFRPVGPDLAAFEAALAGATGRIEVRYDAVVDTAAVRIIADAGSWSRIRKPIDPSVPAAAGP